MNKKEYMKEYRKTHRAEINRQKKIYRDEHLNEARAADRKRAKEEKRKLYSKNWSKAWYAKNKEYKRQYDLKYRSNPVNAAHRKEVTYRRLLRVKYNMTREDFYSLLSSQDNQCPICGVKDCEEQKVRWCVDHDHKTNKIRGILCNACNSMLGYARENPQIMSSGIDYISKHSI